VIVRPADLAKDALAIMAGARDFIARMDAPEFAPETDAELAEALDFITGLPGFEALLADDAGNIVGGIGLLFSPSLWRRRSLAMTELFIWSAPAAPVSTFLRLLRAADARRIEKGALLREFVALTSSPPGIARVYANMGLRKVQESWMGAV
jgi:hypothetical protein